MALACPPMRDQLEWQKYRDNDEDRQHQCGGEGQAAEGALLFGAKEAGISGGVPDTDRVTKGVRLVTGNVE